ncbi:hypothetical protein D3C76_1029980 [compost metagenome]
MARSSCSMVSGNSLRDRAPPTGRAMSPSSMTRASMGSRRPSSATMAWVNARVREGREVPPETATTLIGLVMGIPWDVALCARSKSKCRTKGEKCANSGQLMWFGHDCAGRNAAVVLLGCCRGNSDGGSGMSLYFVFEYINAN